MRSLHAILAAFFALLFVVSTNRCVIAAAFPMEVECCKGEQAPQNSERSLPCGGKDCAPCATLETGAHLASLVPLTITAPEWRDEDDLARLLRRLALAAMGDSPAPPPSAESLPVSAVV